MKTQVKFIAVLLLVSAFTVWMPQKTSAHHKVVISFQVFYDELTPYGTWVYHPVHGYAWVPDAGPGFYPYATEGYWVLTWSGWTWVSNYPWGWAPFHYGRWYMDPYYGPMWIPGYEWGPGWVVWRKSGDYYGWAPIGPGVNIQMAYGYNYHVPHDHWRFLKGNHFGKHDQYNHFAHVSDNGAFMEHSSVINQVRTDQSNYVPYNAGPDRREIERYRGEPISQVTIEERDKPGQNLDRNKLELYKPEVEKDRSTGGKAAPSHVTDLENLKGRTRTSVEVSRDGKDQETYREPVRSQQGTMVKRTEQVRQDRQPATSQNRELVKRSAQPAPAIDQGDIRPSPRSTPQRTSGTVNQTPRNPAVKESETKRQAKPGEADPGPQAGRSTQSAKTTRSR